MADEITSTVEEKQNPSWEDIQKMTVVRSCIKETMRLYMPLPVIGRVIPKDAVLCGYQVPAGVSVQEGEKSFIARLK